MKTIIAGSRTITDSIYLIQMLSWHTIFAITEIISGNADGVDRIGERFAKKYSIPVKLYPAMWKTYGKKAGYIRNKQMAEYADMALIIWDGKSKGTKLMIDLAVENKLPTFIYIP